MTAHFENGQKCDGSKLLASVHTIPAQFENGRKFDGTVTNLLKSPQESDAKEM